VPLKPIEGPGFEGRYGETEGYTIGFEKYSEHADMTPLFVGLPDDRCQSPHWGYVFKGKLVYRGGRAPWVHWFADDPYGRSGPVRGSRSSHRPDVPGLPDARGSRRFADAGPASGGAPHGLSGHGTS